MKLGVLRRPKEPLSVKVYLQALAPELTAQGVSIRPVPDQAGDLPDIDLLWHPGSGMSSVPRLLLHANPPVVCTVHGLDSFAISPREISDGLYDFLNHHLSRWLRRLEWRRLASKVAHVIAVSEYGGSEIERYLRIGSDRISAIHHGVHPRFRPAEAVEDQQDPRYLLHISSFNPKKNYRRMLDAYSDLPEDSRPPFRLIVPGYPAQSSVPPGVKIIREAVDADQLPRHYRRAVCFLFPSLHETFGLPILEAMASGCPVITSSVTACPEVAGEAAILVDPRSTKSITAALERVLTDEARRTELRTLGLQRAGQFSWDRAAKQHIGVFRRVLGSS